MSSEIEDIDNKLLFFTKPSIFTGKNSIEISFNKQFDELCIFVSEQTSSNARDMTVLSFYNALSYIKKKHKSKGK